MSGADLTILVAVAAGLLSFLSPCVLPLVPAYLGQLTAVAVASRSDPGSGGPNRWLIFRHAIAFVAGFGSVFTLLGVTGTYVASGLSEQLPALRQIGGVILIVLGPQPRRGARIPRLERTWRPMDAGAAGSIATATGTVSLSAAGAGPDTGPGLGERLGGRIVSSRGAGSRRTGSARSSPSAGLHVSA